MGKLKVGGDVAENANEHDEPEDAVVDAGVHRWRDDVLADVERKEEQVQVADDLGRLGGALVAAVGEEDAVQVEQEEAEVRHGDDAPVVRDADIIVHMQAAVGNLFAAEDRVKKDRVAGEAVEAEEERRDAKDQGHRVLDGTHGCWLVESFFSANDGGLKQK